MASGWLWPKGDSRSGKRDIWLIDVERGHSEQLTTDPVTAGFPVWTTNGDKVIFASPRSGLWEIYSRPADRVGGEQSLFGRHSREVWGYPRDITGDDRALLFGTGRTLWIQPLDGRSAPYALPDAVHGRVSPDGRWLAYTGTERGERNVYVTTFAKPGRRWLFRRLAARIRSGEATGRSCTTSRVLTR